MSEKSQPDGRIIEAIRKLVGAGDDLLGAIQAFTEIRADGRLITNDNQARIIQRAARECQTAIFDFVGAATGGPRSARSVPGPSVNICLTKIPAEDVTPVTDEFMAVFTSLFSFLSFRTEDRDRYRAGESATNVEPGDEPGTLRLYKRFDVSVLIDPADIDTFARDLNLLRNIVESSRPDPWRPPEGYIGANEICRAKHPPRPTLQKWADSDEPPVERHPSTGELFYPAEWVEKRCETYRPRRKHNTKA